MASRRGKGGPDVTPVGAPARGPVGPRRPASPAARSPKGPGRGGNRPVPSLVYRRESSTGIPDLRLRTDDVGRAFLFIPVLGEPPKPPEPCYGTRCTERLTPAAARHIKGAAIKAVAVGLPLRTFMTFTVRPEDREDVEGGSMVLGSEVRRVLNALAEWLRRRGGVEHAYVWVAENPAEQNPHVHLLSSMTVPRSDFERWAEQIEGLWGHGWVKIERLRKPLSAGHYILKAAGYVAKGSNADQGRVYGNRYGISHNIRPVYDVYSLGASAEAAATLRRLQGDLGDGGEALGRLWLTRYGLSFPAGTDEAEIEETLEALEGRAADGEQPLVRVVTE